MRADGELFFQSETVTFVVWLPIVVGLPIRTDRGGNLVSDQRDRRRGFGASDQRDRRIVVLGFSRKGSAVGDHGEESSDTMSELRERN